MMLLIKINKLVLVSIIGLCHILHSCTYKCKKNDSNYDTMAVSVSFLYVGDNFMEDSILQRENVDKVRRIVFELKLKNNSYDYKYIPMHGYGEDSIYSSKLGFYVNGMDVCSFYTIRRLSHRVLPPNDSTRMRVFVNRFMLENAGLRQDIPLEELLSKIEVRYDKDERDTAYSKYPISAIKIVREMDIVINYKSYENRKEIID